MIIRIKKADAAYLYQVLESYEGVAYYSTLTEDKSKPYRDIEVKAPADWQKVLDTLLEHLKVELELEVLSP